MKMAKFIANSGFIGELETNNYEECIFKLYNRRRKAMTICGVKSVKWVKKFYGNHECELSYIRNKTFDLVIIAGVR